MKTYPCNKEAAAVRHERLCPRNGRPAHHEYGQHAPKAVSLGEELDRELCRQERDQLNCCAVIIVVAGNVQVRE